MLLPDTLNIDIPLLTVFASRTFASVEYLLPLHRVGLDHLLYNGGEAAGDNEESTELRVACFMGLVSFLSSRLAVLRVSPRHGQRLLNAVARPMIQSATLTEDPLTAAGLDGTGEIIQVRLSELALVLPFASPAPCTSMGYCVRIADGMGLTARR